MEVLFALLLIFIAFFTGRLAESSHFKRIRQREKQWHQIPVVTSKKFLLEKPIEDSTLVYGSVVVSVDYFKRVLLAFRQLFGGEIKSYASLIDRARREALLRMKESAPGTDIFLNCRLETSTISSNNPHRNSVACVEVMAYGTAVRYKK